MDFTVPVEVMLRGMAEIHMFLIENSDEGIELTKVLMISYTLIKMANTGL